MEFVSNSKIKFIFVQMLTLTSPYSSRDPKERGIAVETTFLTALIFCFMKKYETK